MFTNDTAVINIINNFYDGKIDNPKKINFNDIEESLCAQITNRVNSKFLGEK